MSINHLILEPAERKHIASLITGAVSEFRSYSWKDRLHHLSLLSCYLPVKLRKFVKGFQNSIDDDTRLCLISNFDISVNLKTPIAIENNDYSIEDDFLACTVASLLGEVFGWQEEQNGRIVHNIVPLKQSENAQESTGSSQVIHWHTDEAFHRYTSDYLAIACIKNPDQIPTTYCSINSLNLTDSAFDILFEPRFIFKKVDSHKSNNRDEVVQSVLYGNRSKPFIRIDHYFMEAADSDSRQALDKIIEYINSSLAEVILKPGNILLIDNALCVHGRNPFKASYDGNDRWLKRVNITRDLYKSRDNNNHMTSRLL